MSKQEEKRSHSLHKSRDGEEFRMRFEAEAGCSVEALIERHADPAGVGAAILAGSIPLGLGTGASDIDIIVLIDSEDALKRPEGGRDAGVLFAGKSAGQADKLMVAESILMLNGVEVDLQFVLASRLRQIAERIAGGGAYLSLTGPDTAILSRVKTGWVLAAKRPLQETCGALLKDNAFEIHCAVRYMVFALQDLEDARAALADNIPLALHLGRLSVEKSFASYFASRGIAFPGTKWLRLLKHWKTKQGEEAADGFNGIADTSLGLLFPALTASREQAASHLDEVARFLVSLRKVIEADRTFAVAFKVSPQLYIPV